MRASTIVLIMVLPVNVLLNILFVHSASLGLLGSPLAISITYWLAFTLLIVLTSLSPTHRRNQTWGGFDFKTVLDFKSCVDFLKLALPGILMVGTEWYVSMDLAECVASNTRRRAAFEIVALAAGRLGALPLAAQSIIMTADQGKHLPFS
jgi:multidrug resistance protein, MATE family